MRTRGGASRWSSTPRTAWRHGRASALVIANDRPRHGTISRLTTASYPALTAPAAEAARPLNGSGTGQITFLDEGEARSAGWSGNVLKSRTLSGLVDGALVGSVEQAVTGMVRPSSNTVTFHGIMRFTGTIDGCGTEVHTLTLRLSGRGQANPPVTSSRVTVVGQPGGTRDVTGHGTIEQIESKLTYDLQYVCR